MVTGLPFLLSRRVGLALLCVVLQLLLNGCHANTRWLLQQTAGLDPSEFQGCGVGSHCTLNGNIECPENEVCQRCNEGNEGQSGWCFCRNGDKRNSDGVCIRCPDPGYIENGDCKCPEYYVPAMIMSNTETCTFCPPPGEVQDDACICPEGNVPGQIMNSNQRCECKTGYKRVSNNSCIPCPDPGYIEGDKCNCPEQFVPAVITVESETCTFCPPPRQIEGDICKCPDGTYLQGDICKCQIDGTSYVEGVGCVCSAPYTELNDEEECVCIPNYGLENGICVPEECKECDECEECEKCEKCDEQDKCKLPFYPQNKNDETPGADMGEYQSNLILWWSSPNTKGNGPPPSSANGKICPPGHQPVKSNQGVGVSCNCVPCEEGSTYIETVYPINDGSGYKYYKSPDGGDGNLILPKELYCH